jgi:uncharacterized membrane protein
LLREVKIMKKKESIITMLIGLVMTIIGIILCVNTYEVKGNNAYSYAMIVAVIGGVILIAGIYSMFVKTKSKPVDTKVLAQAALCAALCYVGATFIKIDIPVGTEKTMFHFGNVFCVLAALLIGGPWGGLAGAVGMTISDLTTAYVTSAPKTFILKLCIGLIVGFFAHRVFKISKDHSAKYITGATIASTIAGMVFNIVADPVVGYYYKTYLLGVPQDVSKVLAKIGAVTTSVNAVIAIICASLIYLALRPVMKKTGMLREL